MERLKIDAVTEQNYKQLFSQAPAPIAIYKGRELRYAFVNDAYSKIFNSRDILGKTVREAFPELEGQPFYGILENVFDTGIPYHGYETPALIDLHNNGVLTTRYYNLVYTPYKNGEGIIEGVMAFGHDVTDQVEARKRERESDLRFRNIVEQSADPILILKGEDLILDVANEPLLELWNVGREAIGKPFAEILPEMEEQGFTALLHDVYHNGKTHYGYETPAYFVLPNGEKKLYYFSFIYQPYRETDGKVTGVLIMATDVTEQVIAKQQVLESERNFRNMILQAPVAMCVLKGSDYVVEIANERMYHLWGKTEDITGQPVFGGLPEAQGQGLEKILEQVYTTGESFSASERAVDLPRNGKIETAYLNFVFEAMREVDGTISGIIAVAIDVTEQLTARKKIEYAEEKARLAIESADLGPYEVDLRTNKMVTSPRFRAIWGADDTADRSEYAAAIHKDDLPTREKAHRESVATGNLHYEARVIWKDNSQHWVRVKGKLLYDEQQKPVQLLGVIQDITEQKLFSQQLTKKVEERTKELKEANKKLERSNIELEQFAYVTSHDLQEPLRKIQVFNDILLQKKEIGEEDKKFIYKVDESAKRMAGLIKDLLDYSSLSYNNRGFEKTQLNSILKNVLSDFELLIAQKNAIIETSSLEAIEAIPLQMNQLFFNLIGNALKFSKKDVTPIIRVNGQKLNNLDKSKIPSLNEEVEYYQIIFEDNGIGFEREYTEKIFTIFQRLNQQSLFGGYGIGLALCRKIVVNHHGFIYAEGQPGRGASFKVILPYRQF